MRHRYGSSAILAEWDHLNEIGFAAMSLSFGIATVSIVANETQMWIERNLTEWDHLNETGFGCDVTLFWQCHRFHCNQGDTDEDRVQFDRVGPFERDWVFAVMSLSFWKCHRFHRCQ